MSHRRTKDYKAVMNAVKELIPENKLQKAVADFERAMWKGIQAIFPHIHVSGCLFHWAQCIWRKTQDLGLAVAYKEKGSIQSFIRKLFALPCLPQEHIQAAFSKLNDAAPPAVQPLCHYISKTWIDSTLAASSLECLWEVGENK